MEEVKDNVLEPCVVGALINEEATPMEVVNIIDVFESEWDTVVQEFETLMPETALVRLDSLTPSSENPNCKVGIGWTEIIEDGKSVWKAPDVEEVIIPPVERYISVGAFYDRFGSAKWGILSSDEPLIQAFVRDCQVRRFINLDAPDVAEGVNYIHTSAVGKDIDPDAIINDPIQPGELP